MNRRRLLTGVGAASAGLLAGCASMIGGDGGGDATQWSQLGEWLAVGSETEGRPTDYNVTLVAPSTIAQRSSALPESRVDYWLEGIGRHTGLGSPNVALDATVEASMEPFPSIYTVTLGEFSRDAVIETLVENGIEQTETRGNYSILRKRMPERAWFVVGDGVVIWLPYGSRTEEAIEPLLSAGRGDATTLLETDEAAAIVVDRLPDSLRATLSTFDGADDSLYSHPHPGALALGMATTYADGMLQFTDCLVFEDEDSARSAPIAADYEGFQDEPEFETPQIQRDGRVVEITFGRDISG